MLPTFQKNKQELINLVVNFAFECGQYTWCMRGITYWSTVQWKGDCPDVSVSNSSMLAVWCWVKVGTKLEPLHGYSHIQNLNRSETAVFWPVQHFQKMGILTPFQYLSSHCIWIRYTPIWISLSCSFTSNSPLCDPMTVGWVAVTSRCQLGVFGTHSSNLVQIANCRPGGETASKAGSFTYISPCDTIKT